MIGLYDATMSNIPYVHAFECNNNKYFYDVNKDAILSVSNEAYTCIKEKNVTAINNNIELQNLKKNGFLSCNRPEIIQHANTELLNEMLKKRVGRVCLQITQMCNFRCKYCVYSGGYYDRNHSDKEMTWDVAKKAIDFMLDNSMDMDTVDVSFYGGEPLLKKDLLSKCVDYTKIAADGRKVTFSMTTNGSLIDEEVVELFLKNNGKITISLDGPREIQDRNRKTVSGEGTFDVVFSTIKKMISKYPGLTDIIGFNMVIDPSVELDPIIGFLEDERELFDNVSVSASTISDDWIKEPLVFSEDFVENWRYGQFRYMLFLLNRIGGDNSDLKLFSGDFYHLMEFARDTRKRKAPLRKIDHHTGPCIPGNLRLFINSEGLFYPCERVSESTGEMIIGNIEDGFDLEKVSNLLNIGRLTDRECINCFAFRNCVVCATMADNGGSLSRERKLHACKNSREMFEETLKNLCVLKQYGLNVDNMKLD